jgi:hypothetical protein
MRERLTDNRTPLLQSFVSVLGSHRAAVVRLSCVLSDLRSIVAKMEATKDPGLGDAREKLQWAERRVERIHTANETLALAILTNAKVAPEEFEVFLADGRDGVLPGRG